MGANEEIKDINEALLPSGRAVRFKTPTVSDFHDAQERAAARVGQKPDPMQIRFKRFCDEELIAFVLRQVTAPVEFAQVATVGPEDSGEELHVRAPVLRKLDGSLVVSVDGRECAFDEKSGQLVSGGLEGWQLFGVEIDVDATFDALPDEAWKTVGALHVKDPQSEFHFKKLFRDMLEFSYFVNLVTKAMLPSKTIDVAAALSGKVRTRSI